MNKKRRKILEVVVALLVISIMSTVTSVAKAEAEITLPSDTEITSPASTNTTLQRTILMLGIALIGGAAVFRRKAP